MWAILCAHYYNSLTNTRSSSSVRDAEGLVQVQVTHVSTLKRRDWSGVEEYRYWCKRCGHCCDRSYSIVRQGKDGGKKGRGRKKGIKEGIFSLTNWSRWSQGNLSIHVSSIHINLEVEIIKWNGKWVKRLSDCRSCLVLCHLVLFYAVIAAALLWKLIMTQLTVLSNQVIRKESKRDSPVRRVSAHSQW